MSTTDTEVTVVSHWIDGAERPSSSGRTAPVYNPATGVVQAEVALADQAEIDEAIASAQRGYEVWSGYSIAKRLNVMFAHLLAELRLAFGLLNDPEFLHMPYVEMNVNILELFEAGKLQEAAAALNEYLVHSERIVLAVYARRISDSGTPK